MNLYINNFSYCPLIQIENSDSLIKDFITVVEKLKTYSFERLYLPMNYATLEIAKGCSFTTILQEYGREALLHQRLKSLIANQFRKIDIDDQADGNSIQYVKWNGNESEFFKRAFNSDIPVVSFKTAEDFSVHQLNIRNEYLNVNEEQVISQEILNNISELDHFNLLDSYLSSKQRQFNELCGRWDALALPIRFRDRVDQYLDQINFINLWGNSDERIRVSLAREVGSYIAQFNGWEYNPSLSRRNDRKVFKALNQSVYLSIDTMHGTFEIHKRNGVHYCEVNFQGDKLEDAQNRHNIEI